MGSNPGDRESMLGGLCGILTGILFVAAFVAAYNFPGAPSQANDTLANFSALRTPFLAADILLGLTVVFAIPFFSKLRNAFDGKDELLVGTATLFAIVGIIVTATVFIGVAITLDTLTSAYATGGATRNAAVVVAQAVIGFGLVVEFSFLLIAAGVALYGFVTIKGRRFPPWLGLLGVVGAFLFLVGSSPVSGAFYLFVAAFVFLVAWIFVTSVYLWRSKAAMAVH